MEITPLVEQVWSEVFETVNNILKTHDDFGFAQFSVKINPSVDSILTTLKVVESLIDGIDATKKLDYTDTRLLLNSKQQIWSIRNVAEALKNKNQDDYHEAIKFLKSQSQH